MKMMTPIERMTLITHMYESIRHNNPTLQEETIFMQINRILVDGLDEPFVTTEEIKTLTKGIALYNEARALIAWR